MMILQVLLSLVILWVASWLVMSMMERYKAPLGAPFLLLGIGISLVVGRDPYSEHRMSWSEWRSYFHSFVLGTFLTALVALPWIWWLAGVEYPRWYAAVSPLTLALAFFPWARQTYRRRAVRRELSAG